MNISPFCWMRVLSLCLLSFTLVQSVAQVPRDNAWQVLQGGSKEKETGNRAIAIRSLGLAVHDKAAEELAAAALQDSAPEVRTAAAIALGKMEAKGSIPALKEAIKDKDVGVILAATTALRTLGDPSCYLVYYAVLTGERKSGEGLVAEQKKMLSDPKKMAQLGFEQGIGFIPFAGLGYSAFKTLTKDDESPVRAAAAIALANDPDPKSGKALVDASQDKSWIVRAAALDALAHRGDPSVIPDIVNALTDSKPEVKYTAAAAIYHLSGNPGSGGK
jgi:HEAT repeat protein